MAEKFPDDPEVIRRVFGERRDPIEEEAALMTEFGNAPITDQHDDGSDSHAPFTNIQGSVGDDTEYVRRQE